MCFSISFGSLHSDSFFNLLLVVPLVWCLTSKKTEEAYKQIVKVLRKKAKDYGWQLTPQHVYSDFEVGYTNTLGKVVSLQRNRTAAHVDPVLWISIVSFFSFLVYLFMAGGFIVFNQSIVSYYTKNWIGVNVSLRRKWRSETLVAKFHGITVGEA